MVFPSDNLTNEYFDYMTFCKDRSPPAHRPGPSMHSEGAAKNWFAVAGGGPGHKYFKTEDKIR
jgi:hypothetical protein